MKDLFIRLMKLTEQKEDYFTECLAETLREDPELCRTFLQKIFGPTIKGVDISNARISIETQVIYPGSCVDMVFRLDDRVSLGIENNS